MDGIELKKLYNDIVAYINYTMDSFGLYCPIAGEEKYKIRTLEMNGKVLFQVSAHRRELEDVGDLDDIDSWLNVKEMIEAAFTSSTLPIEFLCEGNSGPRNETQLGMNFDR